MARPFRLAGLLRVRALQEEQAAAALAEANAERLRAIQRRAETERMLSAHALPMVTDEGGWRAAVARRVALATLSRDAAAAEEHATSLAEARTREWSEARTRTRALDKLAERHRAEVGAEELAAEQQDLDEAARRTANGSDRPASPEAGEDR